MASPAQIAANKSNAQKSTGPKSAAGKKRASLNALKHGILSKSVVIPGEKYEDWVTYRDDVVLGLAPVGRLEMSLAEKVAHFMWRGARIPGFEVGACAEPRPFYNPHEDRERDKRIFPFDLNWEDLKRFVNRDVPRAGDADDPIVVMERNEAIAALKAAEAIDEKNPKPEDMKPVSVQAMARIFDHVHRIMELFESPPVIKCRSEQFLKEFYSKPLGDLTHLRWKVKYLRDAMQWYVNGWRQSVNWTEAKVLIELLIPALEAEVVPPDDAMKRRQDERDKEISRNTAKKSLPPEANVNLIIRYEGHFGRQITNTLKQLFQVQQNRRENLNDEDGDFDEGEGESAIGVERPAEPPDLPTITNIPSDSIPADLPASPAAAVEALSAVSAPLAPAEEASAAAEQAAPAAAPETPAAEQKAHAEQKAVKPARSKRGKIIDYDVEEAARQDKALHDLLDGPDNVSLLPKNPGEPLRMQNWRGDKPPGYRE